MIDNKTKELYSNGKIVLVRDTIHDGKQTIKEYTYIKKQNAVLVVAINDGCIFFVRQYRHIVGKESLELPGGRIEKDERPFDAALRELKEETGLSEPESVHLMGEFYPLLSVTNEKIYVFLMNGLKQMEQNLDDTELGLTVEKIRIDKVQDVLQNEFISGPDMLALQLYFASKYNSYTK